VFREEHPRGHIEKPKSCNEKSTPYELLAEYGRKLWGGKRRIGRKRADSDIVEEPRHRDETGGD